MHTTDSRDKCTSTPTQKHHMSLEGPLQCSAHPVLQHKNKEICICPQRLSPLAPPPALQTTLGIDYPSPQALSALMSKQEQLEKQQHDTQVRGIHTGHTHTHTHTHTCSSSSHSSFPQRFLLPAASNCAAAAPAAVLLVIVDEFNEAAAAPPMLLGHTRHSQPHTLLLLMRQGAGSV